MEDDADTNLPAASPGHPAAPLEQRAQRAAMADYSRLFPAIPGYFRLITFRNRKGAAGDPQTTAPPTFD